MKFAVAFGKVGTLALWTWGVLSFATPTMVPQPSIGRMVFLGLLAVHVAEAFAFANSLSAEDNRPLRNHVGKLLVFGYFHVLDVRYG